MSCYKQLGCTKAASIQILFSNIVDIPHHVLSVFYALQMMSIIMNLQSFVPTTRDK